MDVSNTSHPLDTYHNKYANKLISDKDREIYQFVNYYVITSTISFFGVIGNLMNIAVFYKQGFKNTMNISFFALAISDLCSLITLLWNSTVLSGLLVKAGFRMVPEEVTYITAGHPHICFARITSWITVFITAERCLCIILPLKIKQIITPSRTTVILCVIYILIILSFEPEYETAYLGWKLDVKLNKTFLGLKFTHNRHKSEGLAFILYSVLGFASFITVVIFTLLLVHQLNKQSKWRMKMSSENARSESTSARERKTMTMVVMIASVLIVCYAPGVAISSVTFIDPAFAIRGQYVNMLFVLWSFVFVFESLNSSVNIFLYYHMSTKYRETFRLIFCCPNSKAPVRSEIPSKVNRLALSNRSANRKW